MIHGLMIAAVLGVVYGIYKHVTLAQVKAEVLKLEAAGVADAKTIYATLKSKL